MSYMDPFPRGTRVSQAFGSAPGATYNGVRVNPDGGHTGRDNPVKTGTPVHAAGDGVIVAARVFGSYNNPWLLGPFGGNTLVLDCGEFAPTFVYAHLSKFLVKEGDRVTKGQVISLTGNTGASTGDHCHTEALPPFWNMVNGTYGRVNPELYFTEYPGETIAGTINLSSAITTYLQEAGVALELKDLEAIQGLVNTSEGRIIADNRAQVAFAVEQLAKKIADSEYQIKVFAQASDQQNSGTVINEVRAHGIHSKENK